MDTLQIFVGHLADEREGLPSRLFKPA